MTSAIFDLQGTTQQNLIVHECLARCDFPWREQIGQGLKFDTGRDTIPVDWQDLTRYRASEADSPRAHGGGAHEDTIYDPDTGEMAHTIEYRSRVLGLAWYSGRITLENSLVNEPELAGEVFLSEVAHMWDFFGMTDTDRVTVWNAVHPPEQHIATLTDIVDGVDLGHGHGWFDVGDYYQWVGEALMGLFVRAFSDYSVTIDFPEHPVTPEAAKAVREIVYPPAEDPSPVPEPVPDEPAPVPEPAPEPGPPPVEEIPTEPVPPRDSLWVRFLRWLRSHC